MRPWKRLAMRRANAPTSEYARLAFVQRNGPCWKHGPANDPRLRGHAHDPEGASEVGERFGCAATDSVHQQLVRGGGMRRSPADSTNRSLAAFGKLQQHPDIDFTDRHRKSAELARRDLVRWLPLPVVPQGGDEADPWA